jgi:MarR family 2-MHQ and catechol resistance regulon transcriptional repressor
MKSLHYKGTRDEVRALGTFVKLVRASDSVTARIHRHLIDAGLSVSQFGVLEALFHVGPLSQAELARKILRSTGNITMVIDNLEKRGLVNRERQKDDRRYYIVQLTSGGRKLIGSIFPRHAAKIMEEMKVLSSAEQETLGNLCRKLGLQQQGGERGISSLILQRGK